MNLSHRLSQAIHKKSRMIIGLMSGMSIDGVDLAFAKISGDFPNIKVELLETYFRSYSNEFKKQLLNGQNSMTHEISKLNVRVAEEFAQCVNDFLDKTKISRSTIDAIGSHGQTLFHSTQSRDEIKSTLQVGSPSIIAELTGLLTIGNFRVRDIAAGGQGAPLVSLADYILFRDPKRPIALNNLGSISNVTVVTPDFNNMLAFDTGPANMVIDYYARLHPKNIEGYDRDGCYSKNGQCIPELLKVFVNLPFFFEPPPKAAGYDDFGPLFLDKASMNFKTMRSEDLMRTAVEFSAITLEQAYRNFVIPTYPDLKRIIFSGGGIYNRTLMNRLSELLPELKIETLSENLANSKEALAFAILANETLSGRAGSAPSLTGIRAPTVLGEIAV
ncbi:MAG: anhydro-N-acetylmuramic acid kinase [Pseudobdellovibrionaceae bacterium]